MNLPELRQLVDAAAEQIRATEAYNACTCVDGCEGCEHSAAFDATRTRFEALFDVANNDQESAAIAAVKFAPVLEFVEKVEAAHAAADGSLKPRDVLVFHGSRNGDFDAETLHALSVVTECCILDLPEGVTVETVDEDEMRNLGWVRV